MFGYLKLEILRSLRDPRYLVLALAAPVGFYILFAGLFGNDAGAYGVAAKVDIMVSMAVYGALWAVLQATGPRIAQDRGIGWLRQIRLLPVRPNAILIARLLSGLALAAPAIVLVFITAMLTHGVRLEAGQWVALGVLLWIGSIPLAVLGIAIGHALGAESAFGMLYGLSVVLSALGGLWMPISMFPNSLQTVGKLLPSFQAANLGWRVVGGHAPFYSSFLVLVVWLIVFAALALYFTRRAPSSR